VSAFTRNLKGKANQRTIIIKVKSVKMTNFVKDRPNGELEKSESTQIQRALVLAIVDGGKDYATVSGTLGLLADVLPYLPSLSPVWEDITEIELSTTL